MPLRRLKYRSRVLLICIALMMSVVSFILSVSFLKYSSIGKTKELSSSHVQQHRNRTEDPYLLPTPPKPTIVMVWDRVKRENDIRQLHERYFQAPFNLRLPFQVPPSTEDRVRFVSDYYKSKRQFYLPSTPRQSRPRFFSYPDRIPTLPEGDFSSFSTLTDAKNEQLLCYTTGSNMTESLQKKQCVCNAEWRGRHCSIPSMLEPSAVTDSLLAHPRRVIYAFGLNHEVEHALTTLSLLWDVVDVFVIGEMNITQYGDPRPWFIRGLLDTGIFRQFEHKILYVPCGFADPRLCLQHDSYVCDNFKYTCLEGNGIRRIPGIRDDDLIMYTDADEFVPALLVHALRYHKTDHLRFSVNMSWLVYGCSWRTDSGAVVINFGAIAGFAMNHSLLGIRGRDNLFDPIVQMTAGRVGVHCSWCFDIAGMKLKLLSAVNSDFPRWGDYAVMANESLIEFVVSRGTFFNLEDLLTPVEWRSLEHESFRDAPFCKRYGFNGTTPTT